MKKGILFLGIGMLTLASCKKTFTCDCNATLTTSGAVNYKHTLKDSSKKNAKIECENIEYNSDQQYRLNGGSYICVLR